MVWDLFVAVDEGTYKNEGCALQISLWEGLPGPVKQNVWFKASVLT